MQDRRKPVCTWQRQTPQRHLAADGSRQELSRLGPVPWHYQINQEVDLSIIIFRHWRDPCHMWHAYSRQLTPASVHCKQFLILNQGLANMWRFLPAGGRFDVSDVTKCLLQQLRLVFFGILSAIITVFRHPVLAFNSSVWTLAALLQQCSP